MVCSDGVLFEHATSIISCKSYVSVSVKTVAIYGSIAPNTSSDHFRTEGRTLTALALIMSRTRLSPFLARFPSAPAALIRVLISLSYRDATSDEMPGASFR